MGTTIKFWLILTLALEKAGLLNTDIPNLADTEPYHPIHVVGDCRSSGPITLDAGRKLEKTNIICTLLGGKAETYSMTNLRRIAEDRFLTWPFKPSISDCIRVIIRFSSLISFLVLRRSSPCLPATVWSSSY